MTNKTLLETRKKMKDKKPDFIRQDAHKKLKLDNRWRRPQGVHSKIKDGLSGYRKKVKNGYGSPKEVRGLNKSGLLPVKVNNVSDLKNVKEGQIALVNGKVGVRNKVVIYKKAIEMKLPIMNIKNVEKFLKDVETKLIENKKLKEEKKKAKESKDVEKKKKATEAKKKEESQEEKTEEEKKKEKDKILTKKD